MVSSNHQLFIHHLSLVSPPLHPDSSKPSLHTDWVQAGEEEGWILCNAVHASGNIFFYGRSLYYNFLLFSCVIYIYLQIINQSIFSLNMWLYSFILKLVPCVVLTILTACLIKALYKVRRKNIQ